MRLFKLLLCIMVSFQLSVPALASSSDIKVKVNDRTIAMDTSPYISGNHTLVPIRFVAEALNADKVSWNSSKRNVTIKDNNTEILLSINSSTAYVNGKAVKLDIPAKIKNNRTYIPVRFVSENMGAKVSWNSGERTVYIYKSGITPNIPYNEDELYWLSRIIHAEAQGEPFEGKMAVGNVILNRVSDSTFPNSIYGVIFDRKNGTQFTPVANGAIYNNPANESYYAADRVLRGENVVGKSLFFCNPSTSTNSWIMNNRILFSQIGNHNFYL